MKIASIKRPIQHITLHPKGHNLCLQGLHGIDIITPGTSTVDHIRDLDTESLQDFRPSQTQRRVNAFIMSWTIIPPKTRFARLLHLYDFVVLGPA